MRKALADIRAEGLDYGVLLVVDDDVVNIGPQRMLEYFIEIGVERVCLINVIPINDPAKASRENDFISWDRFVEFLRGLFGVWWPTYADRITFREISDLMGKIQGREAATCLFAGKCMGQYLTVEPAGEVAACDKYIGDERFRFGNIFDQDLSMMSFSPSVAKARADTADAVSLAHGCQWFAVCQGGCPHDRYLRQRYARPQNESCCGLAPLLSDIATAISTGVDAFKDLHN